MILGISESNIYANNTNFGQPSQPVFTSELHPELSFDRIHELNRLMNEMFNEIQALYVPNDATHMPVIHQFLIHMHGCSACKQVLQPFLSIGRELQKRLPFFEYKAIELNETVSLGEKGKELKISGGKFYTLFDQKGVPFVLQDFIASKKKFGKNFRHVIEETKLMPTWEGIWKPFHFVAKTWDIENKFISESIDNYKKDM